MLFWLEAYLVVCAIGVCLMGLACLNAPELPWHD